MKWESESSVIEYWINEEMMSVEIWGEKQERQDDMKTKEDKLCGSEQKALNKIEWGDVDKAKGVNLRRLKAWNHGMKCVKIGNDGGAWAE